MLESRFSCNWLIDIHDGSNNLKRLNDSDCNRFIVLTTKVHAS